MYRTLHHFCVTMKADLSANMFAILITHFMFLFDMESCFILSFLLVDSQMDVFIYSLSLTIPFYPLRPDNPN